MRRFKMIRRILTSWIIPLLMLAILADGSRTASQGTEQPTAAPTQAQAAATSAATLTVGAGSFNLQPTVGLADLSSYQATLKMDFQGNTAGKADPWTETQTLLASAKPPARALTVTVKGNVPGAAGIAAWSALMNGMFYWKGSDGACVGSVVQANPDPAAPPAVQEPA